MELFIFSRHKTMFALCERTFLWYNYLGTVNAGWAAVIPHFLMKGGAADGYVRSNEHDD